MPNKPQTFESEIKRILGEKYYEGAGTDFTAQNIIDLHEQELSLQRQEWIEKIDKLPFNTVPRLGGGVIELINKDDVINLLTKEK